MTKELHELSETAAWMSYLQITTSNAHCTGNNDRSYSFTCISPAVLTCHLQIATSNSQVTTTHRIVSHDVVIYKCTYGRVLDCRSCDREVAGSGPTMNSQKSQDLVTKNPKIEQKFPSYTENMRKQ